jgi:type I restriction enzyme S subunit
MLDKKKNKGEYEPYLSNKNVRWGEFEVHGLPKMRFEHHEHERFGLKKGDLIVCEGGEPGRCAIWKDELPNMKIQKALHRVRVKKGFCNEFLYYRMLLAGKTGELKKHFIGSTILHLTGAGLKDVEFEFPEYQTQKKISSTLSVIDRKIELNNKINAELEAMAKLIYDYWFVQFDFPDENGKPYKSSGGKMVYKEELKREIPEEWNVSELDNVCKRIQSGGTPLSTNEEFYEGEVNWFTTSELQDGFLYESKNKITANAIVESSAKMFPAETVVIAIYASPTVGRVGLLTQASSFNQACCGLIVNQDFVSQPYLYETLILSRKLLNTLASGTTQKNLGVGTIKTLKVVIPAIQIMNSYTSLVEPMFEKQRLIGLENQELASLRDWLLPMLMNGQVKVGGAKELLKAAEDGVGYGKMK